MCTSTVAVADALPGQPEMVIGDSTVARSGIATSVLLVAAHPVGLGDGVGRAWAWRGRRRGGRAGRGRRGRARRGRGGRARGGRGCRARGGRGVGVGVGAAGVRTPQSGSAISAVVDDWSRPPEPSLLMTLMLAAQDLAAVQCPGGQIGRSLVNTILRAVG